MNERIKELIAEADRKCSETRGIYDEILAKLIIRECYDVVINDGRFHDAKGILKIGKYVAMEHFGVEE